MKRLPVLLAIALPFLISACHRGPAERTALHITTRQGADLTLVVDHVEYLKVCYSGSIDPYAGVDDKGLRVTAPDPDAKQPQWKDIRWADIDSISFGAPAGNVGGFCEGLPERVAAVITGGGQQQSDDLLDTTDEGIVGLSPRGRITVPIRNIAKLERIPDQHWAWGEASNTQYAVTLRGTGYDGKPLELVNPEVGINRSKKNSFEELQWPFGESDDDAFTLVGAGVRYELPWQTLKSLDFEALQPGTEAQKVRVTFMDGSSQELDLLEGAISASGHTLAFDELKHLDVEAKPKAAPTP